MIIGGLLALIAVVLLPTLRFGFVYDDWWTFVSNGFLRRPGELGVLLRREAVARNIPDAFRPTLVVFDVITYQLFATSRLLHHLLSVALHLTTCWLLERWLAQLGAPVVTRAATIALFGLMAVHAEAIAVVSFREDLLAAALGLLALLVLSRGLRAPGRTRARTTGVLLLGGLVMAAACGAKMSAATLPLLWLLAEQQSPWRTKQLAPTLRALGFVALGAGVGLAIAHTVHLHGGISPYGVEHAARPNLRLYVNRVGLGPVLAQSTQIHLAYLQQMIAPYGLSPEYTDRGARWTDPATILASAALVGLLMWGVYCGLRRRRPLAALALLGALALAIPTSNLAAMPNMRADRFLYLTSVPVCLGLASLCLTAGAGLARRFGRDAETRDQTREWMWRLAPLVAYGVVQGAVLQGSVQTYASSGRLWTVALQRAPDSARAHALFTESLLAAVRRTPESEHSHSVVLTRIEGHCRNALRLDPHYELSEVCMARLALARRQWEQAHHHFSRALVLSPDRNMRLLAALAQISLDRPGLDADERKAQARMYLDRGLREYPYAPELRAVSGRIAHLTGDPEHAALEYREAESLAPERLQTIVWGLELALDLGDALAARKIWVRYRKVLGRAPEVQRASLLLRTREVERLFPSRTRTSILTDGVFPDEP